MEFSGINSVLLSAQKKIKGSLKNYSHIINFSTNKYVLHTYYSSNGHSHKRTAPLTATLFETLASVLTPIHSLCVYILKKVDIPVSSHTLSEITTCTFSLYLSSHKQTPQTKSY